MTLRGGTERLRLAADLRERGLLDLADHLPREVQELAAVLEGLPAAVGDVERARLRHLPHLEVGEVELHRAGARVHVDREVVLARGERARPRLLDAVAAHARALDLDDGEEDPPERELLLGRPLHRDRAGARSPLAPSSASRAAYLPRRMGRFGQISLAVRRLEPAAITVGCSRGRRRHGSCVGSFGHDLAARVILGEPLLKGSAEALEALGLRARHGSSSSSSSSPSSSAASLTLANCSSESSARRSRSFVTSTFWGASVPSICASSVSARII